MIISVSSQGSLKCFSTQGSYDHLIQASTTTVLVLLIAGNEADVEAQTIMSEGDEADVEAETYIPRDLKTKAKLAEFYLRQSLSADLREAAEVGDVIGLQRVMASNPELLYWESGFRRNTALHIAASKGHVWFAHHFLIFMNLNSELVIKENWAGDTPLHLAIRAGHVDVVEHLIQYVAWARNKREFLKDPLMVQNYKQNTLLHESVIHSRCDVATKLLASAKVVTLKGSALGATVGMLIVDAKEVVRLDYALLLLWNAEKQTPLHIAVKDNNFEMVEILIKYDQDMKHDLISRKQIKNYLGSKGNQADVEDGTNIQRDRKILKLELNKAAEDGDVMSLQELMASNPRLLYWESSVVEENTALHIAASKGHVWFVHHFLIFMGLNSELVIKENMDGNTPLHLAVRAGHLDVVEQLIQYVAWARSKQIMKEPLIMLNKEGNTLMHEALIKGLDNVADILLEYCRMEGKWSTPKAIMMDDKYVDHNIKISDVLKIWGPLTIADKEGNYPLHLAAMNRISDMALKFLDDIPRCAHWPNRAMQSPLYIAVMNGLDHVINKIAKQGLSVPAISISIHGTAVHQAVLADNIRALEILLSKYARLLEVPDKEGNSALHYAAKTNNSRMTSMLLKKDHSLAYKQNLNQRRCPLHVATEHGSLETVKELLKQRPDVSEMVDINGQNVFHIAVTSNRVNVLKWFLQCLPGDLVNQQDIYGYTPLHLATKRGLVEQALLLLRDPRVDPCIANGDGDTAFSISERMGILGEMGVTADEVKLWNKLKKHESTRRKQKKMVKRHFGQQGQGIRYTANMARYALVATLIAVTTFVATLKYSGLSSFANVRHRLPFKILVICNTMSMCSSGVVVMSTIWPLRKQLEFMVPWAIWASRLIVFAGFMMIMSMLTTIYLTIAPSSQWLAYVVISIGITALFLDYYIRKIARLCRT